MSLSESDLHRDYILELFAEALKTFRKKREISQEKLAELAKLDRSYIAGLESGVRNPTLITIIKIAKALNVCPSDLISEMEKQLWCNKDEKNKKGNF